ncbi:MAG: molybdopterin cofactor-binding domain-containing protein [Acidimicrobiales bacterium]
MSHTGRSVVACDISRWEADHLAVVIAESRDAAARGAAAIDARWEVLPLASDLESACRDEVLVHAETAPSNAYYGMKIRKGDIDAGWAAADVVIEGRYELPHQEHAYLQVEAATGWVDEQGRITVETSGQWTHEDRDRSPTRSTCPTRRSESCATIGGAFGGKEDMSLQIVMALAVRKLRELGIDRPVHCRWSREESIVGHHKRHRGDRGEARGHPGRSDHRGRGRCVARRRGLQLHVEQGAGERPSGGGRRADVPNARIDSHAVYTHSVPGGAFRGFGGPQEAFVAETQMNKLAATLGIDPFELRRINTLRARAASASPRCPSLPG